MDVITIASEAWQQLNEKLDKVIVQSGKSKSRKISEAWLDSQEVCSALKIKTRTLNDYKSKGIVGSTTINGKSYYKAEEIAGLLEKNYTVRNRYI